MAIASAPHWSESVEVAAFRDARRAASLIAATGCSEAGLKIMMRKGLPLAIAVREVPLRSAILIKQEAISSGGDAAYSAEVAPLRADRTDVVILTSPRSLGRLLAKLDMQPFGLKRLASAIRSLDIPKATDFRLTARGKELPLGARTYVMGILNATPDSFSDGGLHFKEKDAISHALSMISEGADIIDIGGESTRPGSEPVPADEEKRRVLGIVRRLVAGTDALISVDTTKPEVAEACLEAGAHMINDVSGLAAGPKLAQLCASAGAALVIMHMRGTPKDMMEHATYGDLTAEVIEELYSRAASAEDAGLRESSIVIDPGFGFSKDAGQNIALLKDLPMVANMGYPLLVGLSRKSTIGRLTGMKDASMRMPGSLAAMTAAVMWGADIVRVHDVAESVQAAKVADALRR
ncbi:MAG TPA: dihydropteroate synthase [Bacillota bacterium]|nr:dihydropteroate synthase [Bacillota bacterium]HOG52395.1 dihydropteroate synthase [Bacillota bacterium]